MVRFRKKNDSAEIVTGYPLQKQRKEIWYVKGSVFIAKTKSSVRPMVILFALLLYVPINSYGHCGTVSSPNHTFSWVSLNKLLTSTSCTCFACYWQQLILNVSAEERKMTLEIISRSISTKVWDRAVIELATPVSAVRHASVARHITDCTTRPSEAGGKNSKQFCWQNHLIIYKNKTAVWKTTISPAAISHNFKVWP